MPTENAFGACTDSEGPDQTSQSDQGLCCQLPEPLDTIECSNVEQTPRWDRAHAQDDVNPHDLSMREGTFLLEEAHLKFEKT